MRTILALNLGIGNVIVTAAGKRIRVLAMEPLTNGRGHHIRVQGAPGRGWASAPFTMTVMNNDELTIEEEVGASK